MTELTKAKVVGNRRGNTIIAVDENYIAISVLIGWSFMRKNKGIEINPNDIILVGKRLGGYSILHKYSKDEIFHFPKHICKWPIY